MDKSKEPTPEEYARKYGQWQQELYNFNALAECICQDCIVCCLLRPALLSEVPEEET